MQSEKDLSGEEHVAHKEKHAHHESQTPEVTEGVEQEETVVEEKAKKVINIKLAVIVALVVILGAVLYSSRGFFVAATVNGSPISRLSVVSVLEKSAGKKTLDAIITKKLIADAVQKEGASVSATEVDAEIKNIEGQVSAAGNGTLTELLAQQGMTMTDLREQIMVQKQLEKLLGDKIAVTEKEVDEYIATNKYSIPQEQLAAARVEISDQLKQQKLSAEGQKYVATLRADAKINYFVKY